jgi:hypothetical protein
LGADKLEATLLKMPAEVAAVPAFPLHNLLLANEWIALHASFRVRDPLNFRMRLGEY